MQLLSNTKFDFINKHRTGFLFSAVLITIGIAFLIVHGGPNFGIDFRGGVKVEAIFNRAVTEAELKTKLTEIGYADAKIQLEPDENKAFISMGHRPEFQEQSIEIPIMADPGDATATSVQVSSTAEKVHLLNPGDTIELVDGDARLRTDISTLEKVAEGTAIQLTFAQEFGIDLTENATIQIQASVGNILTEALLEGGDGWQAGSEGVNVTEVGPSVGRDLKWSALWSVLSSIAILLLYISWRFEFRFAIGAIAALVHDVLITLGLFAVLAKEINLPTVAAFLTIIGYSLNDTIVVFDRIRENGQSLKGVDYVEVLNRSINQSLSRTVITSITTLFVVIVIFVLSSPGEEINTFALALIVGVLIGTYSSVFIASPILHIWQRREQKAGA
ncbi:MAG: protein translocase subunit SecF [Candidatus Poribacteria bacterium]|nr:protein translocase subunit SecF [Candidatus Poribacteria bacterium]MDE0318139.1 protein translocase subunit SecF [Candidatus Poribacteria bacterium]